MFGHMKKITRIERATQGFIVTLPEEMFAGLGLGDGDEIVVETAGNTIELSAPAPAPDVERALKIARKGARKYRNALAELAK